VLEPAAADAGSGAGRASDPFRVVLGHVRSGTTLLRAMLDSHPDLAVPPESYFVASLLAGTGPLDWDRFVAVLAADRYFPDWHLPVGEVRPALEPDPRIRTRADAVAGLYALYARRAGKPAYADKTPSHLHHVDLLAASFPAARFLHIVRDGRDVCASVVSMDFGAERFADAVLDWRRNVLRAHRAGLALGPDRYRLVHYEDLVVEPGRVLREVCGWFGLDYRDDMLRYQERADSILAGLRDHDHIQGIRSPPTPGLRDWHVDLTPRQIATFDEIAGDASEALGYERSGLARSWRSRMDAWGAETRVVARRTVRLYPGRVARRVRDLYRRVRA
jgi:hypothetical protein